MDLENNKELREKKRLSIDAKIILSIIGFMIIMASVISGVMIISRLDDGKDISQAQTLQNDGNNANFKTDGDSIENVSKKLSPSVVSVLTKSRNQVSRYYSQEQSGAGTGIVVSKNGYILTNKHVVSNANTVSVVLSDGTTYDSVKVVGSDPLNDIAFLKISNVDNLTPAELGDSKTLIIGQQVVAMGNALGQYQNSVTSGIVSGTNRSIQAATDDSGSNVETLSDMIQTDASINPGNSGGPLVNAKGQVVGINTAVASSAQGIGFAIPIGAAKGMLTEILETGKVERAYVGVNYLQITPDVAKEYKLPVKTGAYVYSESGDPIASGGPAAKAGLKNKDIITKVNGVEVGEKGSVSSLTAEYKAGEKIKLTLIRDNKEMTVNLELGKYPAQ